MGFGRKHMNNPTPHSIANLFDMLAGFFGILNTFLVSASFIPSNVSDPISCVLTGLAIPALLYFKRWFGKQVNETNVDAGDVMEIKDPPNENN